MKNLFALMALSVLSVGWLSSCSTLFDVSPKAIYSPIELDAKLIPQKLSESMCKVSFIGKDASLAYGALVFYDSVEAASFVRERKIIGQAQSVSAVAGSSSNLFISDTIKFNNTKGQYAYITPFAYRKEDVDPSKINYFGKAFSAKGYMQLKISPWTHMTDIAGVSPDFKPTLFLLNNKLNCVKSAGGFIYNYEFDTSTKKWIERAKLKNEFKLSTDLYTYVARDITGVYFVNNQFRLVTTLFITNSGQISARYCNGIVTTNNNFSYVTHEVFPGRFGSTNSNIPRPFYLTDVQVNSLRVIFPLVYDYSTVQGLSTNLLTGTNELFYYSTEPMNVPTISMVVNNKWIANSTSKPNTFTVYDLADASLKKLQTISYDKTAVWAPTSDIPSGFVAAWDGQQTYLLNNALNIYRVTLDASNQPVFTNLYAGWFPTSLPTALSRAILFSGSIWLLVNNYELWSIDPSQITIDFSRPGAYTIVPL